MMLPRLMLAATLLLCANARAQTPEPEAGNTAPETATTADAEAAAPGASDSDQANTTPAATENSGDLPAPPAPPSTLELPAPAPGALPPSAVNRDEITLDDWQRSDWELVKPKISLIDLDGYFRWRSDILRKLDFDNDSVTEYRREGGSLVGAPRYAANSSGSASFTGSNMRLRIEPRLNISESIHVITTFDIFDNLSLGSTPNSLPGSSATPNNVLSSGQANLRSGVNSLGDSVIVKRAYAHITALNEQLALDFGRMPNHWGLGMLHNSGDCLDCDFDDITDRIALTVKAANHLITPMFDWVSSGPVYDSHGQTSQALDAVTWDDVSQYSLQARREDHPETIAQKLADGQSVLNYGLWIMTRQQTRDLQASYYEDGYEPGRPIADSERSGERRDSRINTGDAWLRLHMGDLKFSAEAAVIWGSFRDRLVPTSDSDTEVRTTDVLQWGGTFDLDYRFDGDYRGTALALKGGIASGDSAPGFGALDHADTQRGRYGPSGIQRDSALNNFQFSPNHHVDLLLFRRVIGTVTDAWYVAPQVAYDFDERVNGRFSLVYSQALFKRSTPSCFDDQGYTRCRVDKDKSGQLPLGLELNGELGYGLMEATDGGDLRASVLGGVLFPFGAFNNPEAATDEQGGSMAWTLQWRVYVTF